jgi:PP-loop superfamily ATP-utilizing enzyme
MTPSLPTKGQKYQNLLCELRSRRHGIDARLKALGYRHVAVDLAGYRMGNLNEKTA